MVRLVTKCRKVKCPIVDRNGKEHLLDVGTAYVRDDGSISLDLSTIPMNGKLVIVADAVQS